MLRSLILICCLLASVVEAGKEPVVIIISMDGVSHNIGENLSLKAVAYTDLRANATREELVCRFLPEKTTDSRSYTCAPTWTHL